jgi:two-component system cell cycle response regulator DivK
MTDRRHARSEDEVAGTTDPLTILLVDDVADIRRLYANYFEHVGAMTVGAGDGAQALKLINDRLPTAVLLDLAMPGLDGIAVLRILRSDPRTRGLPVVALTGLDDESTRAQAFDAGVDLYLTKPCLPHVVFGILMRLLGRDVPTRRDS